MIRRIQIVLISICLILFFFISLVVLLEMIPWAPISGFGLRVAETFSADVRFLMFLAAVVMILAVAALQLRLLREHVLITKEGDEGRVTIVESAITRYVKQVIAEIESVQKVWVKIAGTPQGLVVDLFARVLVTDTLPRIEQTIRSRVREALEQTLGVGGVAAINVIVEGFQKVAPRAGAAGAAVEVKLTGEGVAAASGETTALRWGRVLPRREESLEEPQCAEPKSGEVKGDDGQSGPQ